MTLLRQSDGGAAVLATPGRCAVLYDVLIHDVGGCLEPWTGGRGGGGGQESSLHRHHGSHNLRHTSDNMHLDPRLLSVHEATTHKMSLQFTCLPQ